MRAVSAAFVGGTVNNYEYIKELRGGTREPVYLALDLRDQSLCVHKRWDKSLDPEEDRDTLDDIAMYRAIYEGQQHASLIRVREILDSYPNDSSCTVVLELCNAGTVADFRRARETYKRWIPESLLWHIAAQAVDGLITLRLRGMSHGDCHNANVFLQFNIIESIENPRPIVTAGGPYPNAVLADFMPSQHRDLLANEKLAMDLNKFFTSLWLNFYIEDVDSERCPYSDQSIWWIRKLALLDPRISQADLEALLQQFVIEIQEYRNSMKLAPLPDWLIEHFNDASASLLDDSPEAKAFKSYRQGGMVMEVDDLPMPNAPEPWTANDVQSVAAPGQETEYVDEWGIPKLTLANIALIEACELHFNMNRDLDYRFIFANSVNSDVLTQANKLAWIGGATAELAQRAGNHFQDNGRKNIDFDRVMRFIDLSVECHRRSRAAQVVATEDAALKAVDKVQKTLLRNLATAGQGRRRIRPVPIEPSRARVAEPGDPSSSAAPRTGPEMELD